MYFPTLSSESWQTDSKAIADAIFSHLFLSDYNQTSLFREKVTSIPYLVQKNQGDVTTLLSDLRLRLREYFARYFTNIDINVSEIKNTKEDSAISICLMVTFDDEDGKTINLGKLFTSEGIKITKITDLNNEGV